MTKAKTKTKTKTNKKEVENTYNEKPKNANLVSSKKEDITESKNIADFEECCEILTEIIRARVGDFVEDSGNVSTEKLKTLKTSLAISEIDIREADDKYPRKIKIKMYNRLQAIDKIVEMLNYKKEAPKNKNKNNSVLINIVNSEKNKSNVQIAEAKENNETS